MDKTPDNPLMNLTVSRTVRNEANISVILQQVHPMQRRDEPEERGLSPRTASRRLRRTGSGRSSPASLSRILRAVLFRPIRGAAPLRSVGAAEGGLTPPGAASHYGLACETVAVQLAAPERSG